MGVNERETLKVTGSTERCEAFGAAGMPQNSVRDAVERVPTGVPRMLRMSFELGLIMLRSVRSCSGFRDFAPSYFGGVAGAFAFGQGPFAVAAALFADAPVKAGGKFRHSSSRGILSVELSLFGRWLV